MNNPFNTLQFCHINELLQNIDGGKLKTEVTYMDIQSSNGCTSKDYLYIATMKSYGKVSKWLFLPPPQPHQTQTHTEIFFVSSVFRFTSVEPSQEKRKI